MDAVEDKSLPYYFVGQQRTGNRHNVVYLFGYGWRQPCPDFYRKCKPPMEVREVLLHPYWDCTTTTLSEGLHVISIGCGITAGCYYLQQLQQPVLFLPFENSPKNSTTLPVFSICASLMSPSQYAAQFIQGKTSYRKTQPFLERLQLGVYAIH
ncbi:hypothetical protein CLU79DRAFT_720794 [Phycomyces nitens]|nr:hypothetical protein CLU79DRAFT_720794 [Phycomyces nitens]